MPLAAARWSIAHCEDQAAPGLVGPVCHQRGPQGGHLGVLDQRAPPRVEHPHAGSMRVGVFDMEQPSGIACVVGTCHSVATISPSRMTKQTDARASGRRAPGSAAILLAVVLALTMPRSVWARTANSLAWVTRSMSVRSCHGSVSSSMRNQAALAAAATVATLPCRRTRMPSGARR